MKPVDIFYKSYKKDFWLLHLSLESLKKNVIGYTNIILLIPEIDKHEFDTRNLPERTLVHYTNDYGNGYLFQQWCKINAWNYCYSDFILFADSDMIWDHKINVQDLLHDNRPEILYTNYDQLPDAKIWQQVTSELLGSHQIYEWMRRLPLIYHRSTLVDMAEWKPDLEQIIMKSHRFSEFNLIGGFANLYQKELYNFVNTDYWTYVPPHATQVWSHSSKEQGASELHLREYIRVIETLLKTFGVNINL